MFNKIYSLIKGRERLQQILLLYSVNIISIPIGIITSTIITRFLGSNGYGNFIFLTNIFNFCIIIFSFGFFDAGSRALVLNDDKKIAKEYYGTELIILFGIFLFMAFSLFIYALVDNNITEKGLSEIFFYLIPFSWVFILTKYFETLLQADNKIKLLASTRLYPKLGFLISSIAIFYYCFNYDGNKLILIWIFYILTYILNFIIVINKIKVSFQNIKTRFHEIWNLVKSYGFNIYFGRIFAVGLNALTGVLISYYSNSNVGVGFFGLAVTFSTPLNLIPNVIATTHYKDFSRMNKIPRNIFIYTIFLSVLALITIWIAVGPFIKYFYSEEFLPVINLNFIVSIGVIFHGLADFINRFLGAHGKGRALRDSSILIGILLMILNLTLIPKFGATGAAYTKISSGVFYFALMIIYYKKVVKELI